MKAIFKVLACAAALSFFVACGPSVSGDPQKDAQTYIELLKEDPAKAADFMGEVNKAYGDDWQKLAEFGTATAGAAFDAAGDALDALGF